jgi:hypothetical protein
MYGTTKKLVEKQQKIYDKKNSRQKNMEKLNLVTGFFFYHYCHYCHSCHYCHYSHYCQIGR